MYSFDSRIRYSETDEQMHLTIEGLINYFQDCSTFQTESAGAGFDWLQSQGLFWILSSWQIEITRLPRLYETVRTTTVPYALKGFFGLRNYCMDTVLPDGSTGERLATANSVWALMERNTMYPVRVSAEHAARYTLGEKLPMERYMDRKVALPDGTYAEGDEIRVQRQHLDANHHVNNGQYVRFALEAIDGLKEAGLTDARISRIRAEYKKQARLGDTLHARIYTGTDDDGRDIRTVDLRSGDDSACVVEVACKRE